MYDVRVRFAPSPTGYLHLGGARTALFNWLLARSTGGRFVLRIEDTDTSRSTEESTQQSLNDLEWLGLSWDEGPFFQSRRGDSYMDALVRLTEAGRAYRCTCPPEVIAEKREAAMAEGRNPHYDGTCRDADIGPSPGKPYVWRFRGPLTGETVFTDLVRGEVRVSHAELDDLVLVRSDGSPTYNFCVVVDDVDLRISHVVRGEDHLSNTPKQILLYEAMGYRIPQFAHLPMVKGLSKRKGSKAVGAYREDGYLPHAILNYLARLGWSHGDQEVFSIDELRSLFSLDGVGKAGSAFDEEKLLWVNAQHIYTGDPATLAGWVLPFLADRGVTVQLDDARLVPAMQQVRERARSLSELAEKAEFYFRPVAPDAAAQKNLRKAGPDVLRATAEALESVEPWEEEPLEAAFRGAAEALGVAFGKVAQGARAALTGTAASPGLFELTAILGRDEALSRLRHAADAASEV